MHEYDGPTPDHLTPAISGLPSYVNGCGPKTSIRGGGERERERRSLNTSRCRISYQNGDRISNRQCSCTVLISNRIQSKGYQRARWSLGGSVKRNHVPGQLAELYGKLAYSNV
jgi:hypothetical protein